MFPCEGVEERGAHFGIERLQLPEKSGHVVPTAVVLERTKLLLPLIAGKKGIAGDVRLVHSPERTNKRERHLVERKSRRDGVEAALIDEVEQKSLKDIVAVVAKSYFVAVKLPRRLEKRLAAVPGAEETGVFGLLSGDGRFPKTERHARLRAKTLEISGVGDIRAVLHPDMHSAELYARDIDLRLPAEELDKREAVLAAAERNENPVSVLQERPGGTSAAEAFGDARAQAQEVFVVVVVRHSP